MSNSFLFTTWPRVCLTTAKSMRRREIDPLYQSFVMMCFLICLLAGCTKRAEKQSMKTSDEDWAVVKIPDRFAVRRNDQLAPATTNDIDTDRRQAMTRPDDDRRTRAYALTNRAIIMVNVGRLQDAMNDYNEAIRIDPTCAFAHTGRGNLFERLGEDRRALRDFNKALELTATEPQRVEFPPESDIEPNPFK